MLPASNSSSAATPDYVKVQGIPGLYRHTRSGMYLGLKKVEGKRKERSLKTTLEELFAKLLAVSADKSASSLDIIEGVRDEFLGWWAYGSKFQVRNVRPSHLEEWLALLGNRVSNSSSNHDGRGLKQPF